MVIKNKKGVFFTIFTIVVISLFLFTFAFYAGAQERKEIEKRIVSTNNFIFSIEEDIPRQLYILGFRSIFLAEKQIIESGSYINNINVTLSEAFSNGTIKNVSQDLLKDVTISGIQNTINRKATKLGVEINLSLSDIRIEQADPWNLKIKVNTTLTARDKANLATWTRNSTYETTFPIEGFEDPIYVINTQGKLTNIITRSNITSFRYGSDVSNLTTHAFNSWYIASTRAPSFIDRLQGNLNPSQNGIESMVFEPEISAQGLPVSSKSVIDFIYFNPSNNPSSQGVSGMPEWFRLDSQSFSVYGLS